VIGGAVLVIGLLLILAGLVSARIPDGATFVSSGIAVIPDATAGQASGLAKRARNPIRAFLFSPIHPATWYANAAIGLGFPAGVLAFAILAAIASVGFTTLLAGIGVLAIAIGIEGARLFARLERRRVMLGTGDRILAHPYRPLRGGIVPILRAEFADESRWRDVLYVALNFPLAAIEFVVVVALWAVSLWLLTMPLWYDVVAGATAPSGLGPLASRDAPVVALRTVTAVALLPVAASLSQLVAVLHRALVAALLGTSESRELQRQVATLKESRSAILDVEATELHRIERDLHDGTQQRLVRLTMDLGLASERIDADPASAKQLVLDGQEQARQALGEIRDLVRGIAPAILLDRGLVPALSSIAGRGPIPTVVNSDLPSGERLPAAIERAAYFVVTEALANVAKHSSATGCEVRCHRDGSRLIIEVSDDGVGGASPEAGGGLTGLAGRVAALDGTFTVASPAGGPTMVRAEFPVQAWGAPPSYWVAPRS
jgi:signal transduction histidine kinase